MVPVRQTRKEHNQETRIKQATLLQSTWDLCCKIENQQAFLFVQMFYALRVQSYDEHETGQRSAKYPNRRRHAQLQKDSYLQLQTDPLLRSITNNTSVGLHTHSDGKGIPPETTAKATLPSTKGQTSKNRRTSSVSRQVLESAPGKT